MTPDADPCVSRARDMYARDLTCRTLGIALDEHIVAALNGDQITRDPEVPLVAGDTVAFTFSSY